MEAGRMKNLYRRDLVVHTRNVSSGKTRRLMLTVFALLAVALGTFFATVPTRATETAENFIQESIGRGYEILNSTTLSDEERAAQFRNYMLVLTDMRRIALFTLGPYANRASPIETDSFVEAFTDYAVAVYEVLLSKYKAQTLTVVASIDRSADDSVVIANVSDPVNPNAPIIKVALRVRSSANGDPIIIDIQVEGVWLAINQRADFTSYLQQHAGNVPDLTTYLERQARQIRVNGNDDS